MGTAVGCPHHAGWRVHGWMKLGKMANNGGIYRNVLVGSGDFLLISFTNFVQGYRICITIETCTQKGLIYLQSLL